MRDYIKKVVDLLPKLSQEQVKRVLDFISAENDMMDSILESLTTGLIVVDKKWNIIRTNKIADRFLELDDDSKTQTKHIVEAISDKDICEFFKDCEKNDKNNISQEFTIKTSGDSIRFIEISVFSYVSNNSLAGRIIKIYDITEDKMKEVRLRRMENMAGLTTLAANMAHEIKNPLGAISIHIQLIQKAILKQRNSSGSLPEKKFLEDHLDIVNEEIDNLNKLIMNFLFAVRPVKAEFSLVDPSILINNLVNFFKPEFNRYNVSFSAKFPEKSVKILIDEKLFREVLINMLQNAFAAIKERFTECQGENSVSNAEDLDEKSEESFVGKIEIRVSINYDKYVIHIYDNGCGMTQETINRIFEPYFTTKATGMGLGTTMAYKIIKEFSGDIHIKSEVNKGTIFSIELPIPQTEKKLIGSR